MKTLYEGILGDIDKNIDKMDVDVKLAVFDVEFKSFKDFVNTLSKFLKVKPNIEKDYNKLYKKCYEELYKAFIEIHNKYDDRPVDTSDVVKELKNVSE